MKNKDIYEITDITSILDDKNSAMLLKYHNFAAYLGCTVNISPMGKKADDWKFEYITKKPKRTLFILRFNKKGWSIRCKLFNIADYEESITNCTERIKLMLIATPNCEMHGGRCKGPVKFSINADIYSKCRHYILFQDLQEEDWACVRALIDKESKYKE